MQLFSGICKYFTSKCLPANVQRRAGSDIRSYTTNVSSLTYTQATHRQDVTTFLKSQWLIPRNQKTTRTLWIIHLIVQSKLNKAIPPNQLSSTLVGTRI